MNFFSDVVEPVRAAALSAEDPFTVVCFVEWVLKPILVTVSQSLSAILPPDVGPPFLWVKIWVISRGRDINIPEISSRCWMSQKGLHEPGEMIGGFEATDLTALRDR